MTLQTNVMSYGGSGTTISVPTPTGQPAAKCKGSCRCGCNGKKESVPVVASNGQPDFTKMTAAQKVAYHRARWDRILG